MAFQIDSVDARILDLLQRDGRITNSELAAKVNLWPSSALRRVRPLEEIGVIKRYVAIVDARLVGMNLTVFVTVSLERQTKQTVEKFETSIRRWPEVTECHLMAGETDYLLRVVASDMHGLERFLVDQLGSLPSIARIRTSIPLREVKYSTAIPLLKK